MKTNVTLTRKMGEFDVLQRTSDGMFNATELLKQWNKAKGMKKEIGDDFDNNSSKEFINTIIEKENLNKGNSPYLTTRGKNGGTWMHPLLFIDFAMWINPSFKYDVLKFVYDQLIKYRNDAGDAYIEMSCAVSKITPKHFTQEAIKNVARAINYVIYNNHERGMRNKVGEEVKTRELFELERDISKLINGEFIKSYEQLMDYLRKEWNRKWQPKMLQTR